LLLLGQALLLIAFHVNRKRIVADYPRSMDMLRRLVSMDTTSRNSNLELIDFVRDHLDQFGIASGWCPDATGKKANLYATIGPSDMAGIPPLRPHRWCRSMVRTGRPIPGPSPSRTACCTAAHLRHEGFVAIALTWVEERSRGNL
jgi:hypothetical protein